MSAALPESEGIYYLETSEVKVRKHYSVNVLFIQANSMQIALRTLADFIDEYKIDCKVLHIDRQRGQFPVGLMAFF